MAVKVGGPSSSSGVVSAALARLRLGFSRDEVADILFHQGIVTSPTAGLAAAGKAIQAQRAAATLEAQTRGTGAGAAALAPLERSDEGGFSFVIDLLVTDPVTGVQSPRTFVLDSDVPLTAEEAVREAVEQLQQLAEAGRVRSPGVYENLSPNVQGSVTAILRR